LLYQKQQRGKKIEALKYKAPTDREQLQQGGNLKLKRKWMEKWEYQKIEKRQ